MYKLISYWTAPEEGQVDSFEHEYQETHIPLASSVPHVSRVVLTRTTDGMGGEPAFYRAVEVEWADKADFEASLASAEWSALVDDTVRMIEKYNVTTNGALGEPREYA
jgi:uncharacterized protein (TIGR02118 family)